MAKQSRYTEFSTAVRSCAADATFNWYFQEGDTIRSTTFDVVLTWFVHHLTCLQETIESLGKNPILDNFAGLYAPLPIDLVQANCMSYHQKTLKCAGDSFRRVMEAAYDDRTEAEKSIPTIGYFLPFNPASQVVDAKKIEQHWDAVFETVVYVAGNGEGVALEQLDNELYLAEQRDGKPSEATATHTRQQMPWYHSPDEQMPDQFGFGPLTATGKQLEAAIFNRPDVKCRQLKKHGAEGRLWIVKRTRYCLEVFLSSEGSYRTAKSRLDTAAKAVKVVAKKPRAKTSGKRK